MTRLAFKVTKADPDLKAWSWSLFILLHYHLNAPYVLEYLRIGAKDFENPSLEEWLTCGIKYHQGVSFSGYVATLVWFVVKLDVPYMKRLVGFSAR